MPALLRNRNRLNDFLVESANKTPKGCFHVVVPFGGDTFVLVSDPPSVEHILKTNFENYIKGPYFKEKLQRLLGDGIFNTDGPMWKEQRQTASYMFKVKELKEMHTVFERHCRDLLDILDSAADTNRPINVADLFFRLTLDSTGEIAFGYNIGSLHKDCDFAIAFDEAQESAADRFFWPFWKYSPFDPLERHAKILDKWGAELIKARRQGGELPQRSDILSRYMSMDGLAHLSDSYLKDVVLNFMIAGRDTTAQTLSWLFYNLAMNPQKQDELLKEVDRFGSLPSYEEMKQMRYLHGAINETLRLYPPVPSDPKYVVNDDVLPNGYKVPAGVNVIWSMYCMGRLEKYWDKPLEFLPERWLDPEKNKERHPYLFIPFQAGPRTCLGQSMAYLEVKVVAWMILKQFRLNLHDPERQNVTYRFSITLPMLGGLKVLVSRR